MNYTRLSGRSEPPAGALEEKDQMEKDTIRFHPCFRETARGYVRMHLPVAPACNISCKYCVRQYDCANENRPGVTSRVLTPGEAVEQYLQKKGEFGQRLSVAGISGPGDPLANWESVRQTLQSIRKLDPDILLCLSTNGLCLEDHAEELARLRVNSISVTINAECVHTAERIYNAPAESHDWYSMFLEKQWAGISAVVDRGILCKINTVLIRGINEQDAVRIAQKANHYHCDIQNLIPLIPLPGTGFDESHIVTPTQMDAIRRETGQYIRQMSYCRRCRADACGSLQQAPV